MRQCLDEDPVDEILLLLVPILLGDGIGLFGAPGGRQIKFETVSVAQAGQVAFLRFRRRG